MGSYCFMRKINKFKSGKVMEKRRKKYLKRLRREINSSRFMEWQNHIKQEKLSAPKNFSFIDNTDEMLDYFERGRKLIKNRTTIKFDLSEIESLTSDGIAVFASIFTDKSYSNGLTLSGNSPKNPELKALFLGSGFYEHVSSKRKPLTNQHNYLLHKVSNKKVEPSIAKIATDFAAKYTFKDDRKFRPVYEIIIELMANTNNHASVMSEINYDWWLYVFYDDTTNITSYSFLDFGVGIFKSKQFVRYYNLLLFKFNLDQSTEQLASDLLSGKISSRTGLEERGRGFTCIMNNVKNKHFKKFFIITNNVFIDVKNRSSTKLDNEFKGTFVYWEISNEH